MAKGKNERESGEKTVEFTPMAYLVRASLDNRFPLKKCEEIADHILNQVGVLADKHLENIADFFQVVGEVDLPAYLILEAYRINPEMERISEADIALLLLFGKDHFRTVAARRSLPLESILDLDHTLEVDLPLGMTDTFTVEEAWTVALKSALEAYMGICQEFDSQKMPPPGIEEIMKTISWCRQALGLAAFEQAILGNE